MAVAVELSDVISSILSWEERPAFRAVISREVMGGEVENYTLIAYPATSEAEIVGFENDYTMQFRTPTMEIVTANESRLRSASAVRVPGGIAVFAFPLSMPVWGRARDTFKMSGASEDPKRVDEVRIALSGTQDTSLRGHLIYSRSLRICVELSLPTEKIHMRDLRDI